ncbi:hypothetical protein LDK18_05200 [Fusobacterium nucleatum subsp. nucleatum ATCC 23726]|uniref:Uncharacterized protein n=2 Tax=Fusobacterium nucleatum subsp. nucleatum TaxID=76856 RepID=Q8RFG7_FUSNN|nr:hypothetical protein [Fusobacterium nucleatum]AAL94927.1 Hypothetical protein FN0731 [Fusobacterium nucleatum subsp. nucleatum ATCC 25586]AVQ15129.1 hypothetical protein C7Y58_06700 [Fusobacterium nucleatum subsp. nucleatum ATCC 25586]AVQ23598.1 hypothetical protein C4N14_08565 [Fusobacterium nucleatum subsp. nucleatum ATCC 23726]EFG95781.1 hypothetical protein HMPREF0397_0595 [Fusobacterium nucleatum subsp. nucleatum ATCC 23726]WMS30024.1 hypothetical protein RDV57_02925 [Fusobacterium nuc
MKKIILYLFLLGTSLSFGATNDLPDNVEKKIRSAVSTFSGSEKRENYAWYKDSYLEMVERLDKSGIPETDKQMIIKRLEAMYGGNYPKQLARVNDEINDYKGLVNRIREEQNAVQQKTEAENQKSKEEIKSILSSSSIPKVDLDKIEQNAKAEYPNDYTLQKAYIKGAIKTYNDLKK